MFVLCMQLRAHDQQVDVAEVAAAGDALQVATRHIMEEDQVCTLRSCTCVRVCISQLIINIWSCQGLMPWYRTCHLGRPT